MIAGMKRLPQVRQANDAGYVYVLERCGKYKIGFTRQSLARRARNNRAQVVLTILVRQRPSVLEYILNNRFAAKRLPPQGTRPGDKREWFALDSADLHWLQGLRDYIS